MHLRLLVFLFLLISPLICWTQTSDIRALIKADKEISQIQNELDLFFSDVATIPLDTLADCYHDVALRWYYSKRWRKTGDQNFLKEAIDYTKKAIAIKKQLPEMDLASLQKSLSNLAHFLSIAEQSFEGIEVNTEIINLDLVNRKTYNAYRSLAACYTSVGDYYKAKATLEEGIAVNEKDSTNLDRLALAYYELAATNSDLGYKENRQKINEQLERSRMYNKKSTASERVKNKLNNQIDHLQGITFFETENYHEARNVFEKLCRQSDQFNNTKLAILFNSLGQTYFKLGKNTEAEDQYNRALSIDPNYSPAMENLGDLFLAQEKLNAALEKYQMAILTSINSDKSIPIGNLLPLEELKIVPSKFYLLNHLIQKASAWLRAYKSQEQKDHLYKALETFQMADHIIDVIRQEALEEQSKLYWLEKGTSLYLNAVEVCYLLDRPEVAYYFMEKNKALLLLSDLSNEQAKENAKLPDDIANREFLLKRTIFLVENEIHQQSDQNSDALEALRNNIYQAKSDLEQFQDSLTLAYPDYARATQQINILDYSEFKEKYIDENQIVLQYILGDDQGYGLINTREKPFLFKINDHKRLLENVLEFRQYLSTPVFSNEQSIVQNNLSKEIYQLLLPSTIQQFVRDKQLIVIPDYILQNLPFESLLTNSGKYFIEEAEIRYAYSMSYLDLNKNLNRGATRGFAAFAPVNFSHNDLASLSFSEQEVNALNNICKGEAFVSQSASKKTFLSEHSEYSIIHLSTHADAGDAINPWISFYDEKLFLSELYATKNEAELVVLSACNTSIGELKKGEGAMSLARGFFYAGTNSVVSSLWSTNDKVNKSIMVDFYKGLDEGKSKSSALRLAKLNYLQSNTGSQAQPFYWASNILVGDNSPIDLRLGLSFFAKSSLVFIILAFIFWIYRRRLS